MTIQITVRLPESLIAFVDADVKEGRVRSRADAVAKALHREQRQRRAEADAAIYTSGADADADAIVTHTSAHPVDLGEHDR
jgi:Arc/MetJ-type ribon-helix-helix transcriptional regulator